MDRIKEPSTWAGIATIAGTVSHFLPGTLGLVAGGIAAMCGSLAVFLREGHA
ncbi:hypothetical protein [Dechloromonas sp. HYN0024]|uniref:hypothetical protein n=1 Tax=Dechloromonas sp. HYN0024 TaxID=2231055 RepID=UPI0013C37B39|nr:hypothetical protein [Dechloromonas sp. HYN0024]